MPEAIVFSSLGDGPEGGLYYYAHPIEQIRHRLTILAHDMNGAPLSYGHGAPLRLRNEAQLGFKQVKWIAGMELVANFSEVGGGYGATTRTTSSSATGRRPDPRDRSRASPPLPPRTRRGRRTAAADGGPARHSRARNPISNTVPNWQFCADNRGDLAILKGAPNRRSGAWAWLLLSYAL